MELAGRDQYLLELIKEVFSILEGQSSSDKEMLSLIEQHGELHSIEAGALTHLKQKVDAMNAVIGLGVIVNGLLIAAVLYLMLS